MAARPLTLVSEQEYLGAQYEPDCEFEDGALIERNAGTEKHSWMQAALAAYIFRRRQAWGVNVYTGQRARVRPGKYMAGLLRFKLKPATRADGPPLIPEPPHCSPLPQMRQRRAAEGSGGRFGCSKFACGMLGA